jgi:ribosome-binding factor A
VKRSDRVAARIHEEIAMLVRTLGDPRVDGVVVTRVEVADDLQAARVFVRHALTTGGAQETAGRRAMIEGLTAAGGLLKREVGRALALRRAPNLRFLYDEGQDNAYRVQDLLREIEDERQGKR